LGDNCLQDEDALEIQNALEYLLLEDDRAAALLELQESNDNIHDVETDKTAIVEQVSNIILIRITLCCPIHTNT